MADSLFAAGVSVDAVLGSRAEREPVEIRLAVRGVAVKSRRGYDHKWPRFESVSLSMDEARALRDRLNELIEIGEEEEAR